LAASHRGAPQGAPSRDLDRKVQSGAISWKTAINIWGTATRMCADSAESKSDALRCRADNPAIGVRGPERGAKKLREFIYPNEFLKFTACEDVPLVWRRVAALAVYTYLRAGELRVLRWEDIDLEHGVIHVHQARDRRDGGVKSTKGRQARLVPIEPTLLPLLRAMHQDASGKGLVLPLPSERDMARGFRRYLAKAGVGRRTLHDGAETTRRIVFHDLRGTGITWMAIRGDDHLKIQQRAGHEDIQTTQGYIATAQAIGRQNFGEPFPGLPLESLLCTETVHLNAFLSKTSQKWRSGRDSKPSQTIDNAETTTNAEVDKPEPLAFDESKSAIVGDPPETSCQLLATISDPVEAALAGALERAAIAGEWATVQALARELEARRVARSSSNVVPLDPRRKREGA
jgi:integrase